MIVWVATACGSKVVYHTVRDLPQLGTTRCGRRYRDAESRHWLGTFINVDLLNPDRARPCKRCWPDE